MADLNRTPNPPGSPIEKLLTENPLERIEDYVRGKLGEGPVTNDELVEVFRFYDERMQYEISKQNRILELWANIHTHPGGGGEGGINGVGPDAAWTTEDTVAQSQPLGMAVNGEWVYYLVDNFGLTFERMNLSNTTWQTLTAPPGSVVSPGATWLTDVDGYLLTNTNTGTHLYNPNTDTWLTRTPTGGPTTESCVGHTLNGVPYAFRLNNWSTADQNDPHHLWKYDPTGDVWTQLADHPQDPLLWPGTFSVGGKLYVVGGHITGTGTVANGYVFDPAINSWVAIAPMLKGRIGPIAAGVNGLGYVFGGDSNISPPAPSYYVDGESYDPVSDAWVALGGAHDMPSHKRRTDSVGISSRLITAGGQTGTSGSDDTYMYG